MSDTEYNYIWVFMGAGAWTPTAIFSSREQAHDWISTNRQSGYLGKFPIDISVYDWAIAKGHFKPKGDSDCDAITKQRFGTSMLPHEHYYDGHLGHNTNTDAE